MKSLRLSSNMKWILIFSTIALILGGAIGGLIAMEYDAREYARLEYINKRRTTICAPQAKIILTLD